MSLTSKISFSIRPFNVHRSKSLLRNSRHFVTFTSLDVQLLSTFPLYHQNFMQKRYLGLTLRKIIIVYTHLNQFRIDVCSAQCMSHLMSTAFLHYHIWIPVLTMTTAWKMFRSMNCLTAESDSKHGKIEVEISDLGVDATNKESSELRHDHPEVAVLDSSFVRCKNSPPTSNPRPCRIHPKPKRYGFTVGNRNIEVTTSDTPSVGEAIKSTTKAIELWKAAIEEEFENLASKKTWSIETLLTESAHKPLLTHVNL